MKLDKRIYDNLQECRDIYDPDMSLTIFVNKMFNTKLKHTTNGGNIHNQHILDRFDATISEFPSKDDETKFYQFINKNGLHYTMFLLQYLR